MSRLNCLCVQGKSYNPPTPSKGVCVCVCVCVCVLFHKFTSILISLVFINMHVRSFYVRLFDERTSQIAYLMI